MLPTVLMIVAGIIIVILIAALLMKKSYEIISEVVINKDNKTIYNYIIHLKNQEQYSKWVMADPNAIINYTGVDGTVGFIASWLSEDKNVGVGEQEIIKITEDVGYDVELRFKKPFEGISYANYTIQTIAENQCRLTTTFKTKTPFPMNIMVPFIKRMLLKDMKENESRLSKNLENI